MTIKLSRRRVLALGSGAVIAAGIGAPSIVRAETFPSRPINIINPFSAGGYVDRMARGYANFMQESMGQPMVIIGKPGASGMLGHQYFLQQPDDGYTILATAPTPFIILNILLQGAPYKVEDFDIINTPARDFTLLATSVKKPFKSINEVIDALKKDAGSLSIGVQAASADYVNLMLMADAAGINRTDLRVVTYDGGGPTRNAIAGGVVDVGLVGGEGFLPIMNLIRPLLAFSDERVAEFDAPTLQQVFPDKKVETVAGSQRGFVVHPSLKQKHPDRYEALVKAVKGVSDDPKAVKSLEEQDLEATWYGPERSNADFRAAYGVIQKHIGLLKS